MITDATARAIVLSMPGAEEGEHMGHPDFRVRKKIFATLWPDERKAVVFLDPEVHGDLLREDPDAFSLNAWSKGGALNVHLRHVSRAQFESLVRESWSRKATKKHNGKSR